MKAIIKNRAGRYVTLEAAPKTEATLCCHCGARLQLVAGRKYLWHDGFASCESHFGDDFRKRLAAARRGAR